MISEGYVTNGATVYISSRDAKACEQAVGELNALGKGKAHAIPADFYKEEDIKKLVEEFGKRENSKLSFFGQDTEYGLRRQLTYTCFSQQNSMSWSTIRGPRGERRTMSILQRPGLAS